MKEKKNESTKEEMVEAAIHMVMNHVEVEPGPMFYKEIENPDQDQD